MSCVSRVLLVVVGIVACDQNATAQIAMPVTPASGLFGSGPGADAKTKLDLWASVVEGNDSDVPRSLISTIDPSSLQTGGFSTFLNTSATYAWRKNKTQFAANASSALRHYVDPGDTKSAGHSAGVGFTAETVGGTNLFVNQSVAFTPAYLYGLFPAAGPPEPGDPGVTAPDYAVSHLESYAYTTTMTLGHRLGRRNNVSATGEFFYTDRLNENEIERWTDISSYSLRGRYSRNTTSHTALSTELRYRSGEFGYRGGGTTTELALDIGFDYSRAISATRRLTIGLRGGVSGADYPGNDLGLVGFQRQYRGVGEGTLSYPFTQTWTASANVRRGLEYVSYLPTPVAVNGATASVAGLLTRRIDVLFSAGYATGESALNRNTLLFDTYTGNARIRYGVSRTLAIFAEYLYYYYDFQNGELLLAGSIPAGLERNGVRAGLTLWMPALRR